MLKVRRPVLQLPYDLVRWAFEWTMRDGLPPDEPEVLRLVAGVTWRAESSLTPARAALMLDEVRRLFRVNVKTAESAVREAYDLTMQSRLETLLLPRLPATKIAEWVRVRGEVPRAGILLTAHLGNLLLMATALGHLLGTDERGPRLVVFTARGVPPRRRRGIGAVRPTWINRHLAEARIRDQQRLPVGWVDEPARIPELVAQGRVVLAAFDDRAWSSYVRLDVNEREMILAADPWTQARRHGFPVTPGFIHRGPDKSHQIELAPACAPSLPTYLARHAWPALEAAPGHYAAWLAECRMRASMDDHPLFADYAPDTRWLRWPEAPAGISGTP